MSWSTSSVNNPFNLSLGDAGVRTGLQPARIRGKTIVLERPASRHGHRPVNVQPNTTPHECRSPENDWEAAYMKFGAWKGPDAKKQAREQTRSFWTEQGSKGASWLVRRLRHENHVDALHGVASLLADMGLDSVNPILNELAAEPTPLQAEALLTALKWMRLPEDSPLMERAAEIIERHFGSNDRDIVESSCMATRLLDRQHAMRLLAAALQRTSDAELHELIQEELTDRGTR